RLMAATPPCAWVRNTMPQAMSTTTTVRIAVARLELTPSIPILARMEVSAAKTADRSANSSHMTAAPFHTRLFYHRGGDYSTLVLPSIPPTPLFQNQRNRQKGPSVFGGGLRFCAL